MSKELRRDWTGDSQVWQSPTGGGGLAGDSQVWQSPESPTEAG